MASESAKYFCIFALLLVLDMVWIGSNLSRYQALVQKVQGSPLDLNYTGAAVSYVTIYLALILFAIPLSEKASQDGTTGRLWIAFRHGGLLGFCIYAIYDFTNLSIFTKYDPIMAVVDTCWGTTLFTLVTYASLYFFPPGARFESSAYSVSRP
jgi:uncharacterized membrane protein